MLDRAEELRLAKRWRELRDRNARDRLIESHIPLVAAEAGRLCAIHSFAELVQEGTFGLMKAVDQFDPGRGRRLAAYARPAIRNRILDHIRALQRRAPNSFTGVGVAEREEPDGRESQEEKGLAQEKARSLELAISNLGPAERQVIERCREDISLTKIAQELGISRQRVGQVRTAAIDKIRKNLADQSVERIGRLACRHAKIANPTVEQVTQQGLDAVQRYRLHLQMDEQLAREVKKLDTAECSYVEMFVE